MEKLNQWTNLIGSIAVIAGIAFLAYEIRVNTEAVRSSAYEAYNESANSYLDFQAEYAEELAAIYATTNNEEVTPAQWYIHDAQVLKVLNTYEATYLHHRAGTLDDHVFEGRVDGFRRTINKGGRLNLADLWPSYRDRPFSNEFKTFMETEIIGVEPPDA